MNWGIWLWWPMETPNGHEHSTVKKHIYRFLPLLTGILRDKQTTNRDVFSSSFHPPSTLHPPLLLCVLLCVLVFVVCGRTLRSLSSIQHTCQVSEQMSATRHPLPCLSFVCLTSEIRFVGTVDILLRPRGARRVVGVGAVAKRQCQCFNTRDVEAAPVTSSLCVDVCTCTGELRGCGGSSCTI